MASPHAHAVASRRRAATQPPPADPPVRARPRRFACPATPPERTCAARTAAGGAEDWRHYSLINLSTDDGATDAPHEYVIAVRREDDGRGVRATCTSMCKTVTC